MPLPPDLSDCQHWNGLDGLKGEPFRASAELEAVGKVLLARQAGAVFGGGVRPRSRAPGYERWAVAFAPEALEMREALEPLIEWRRGQFGERLGEFVLTPAESAGKGFALAPLGKARDEAGDPDYLLLVGEPRDLSWEGQYGLDQARAVGRLAFAAADDYHRYARSVVAAERGRVRRERRVALLGPRIAGDRATELSADELLTPLAQDLAGRNDWRLVADIGATATKSRLRCLLGGEEAAALVFFASHGVAFPFPPEDDRQRTLQGALLCADWPGREEPLGADHYFAADDLDDEVDVAGSVVFAFGCCTAGTPAREGFARAFGRSEPAAMAATPFVSALPQRLLAHPRGGALAFVGHVDLAWPYSYRLDDGRRAYREALEGLLDGRRVGDALHGFGARTGDLQYEILRWLESAPGEVDPRWLGILWIAATDARSYVLVGDPAVRLAVPRRP